MIASLFVLSLATLGASVIGCLVGLRWARNISDPGTRWGLSWLLWTAGVWATFQVGYLIVPGPQFKEALYMLGLVVGFSAVGPWLYFCSAYTGRTLHRSRRVQYLALGIFVAVSLVKLTNPLHGLYFSTIIVTTPFRFLAIDHGVLHWVVVGFAYALSTMGYFTLVEQFWQADHDSGPLIFLVGLTGLPILPDLLAAINPQVPNLTYEPIGVALFAIGVLYLYLDQFEVIQITQEADAPVLLIDDAGHVREYNDEARELFPDLTVGEPIDTAAPPIGAYLADHGADVVEVERVGGLQYYQPVMNEFTTETPRFGEAITLTNITDREQYRMQLESQNEKLDMFATTVSHDLRNPLNVAIGRLAMAREEEDSEHLQAVDRALSRMEGLITDVLALAKKGEAVGEVETISLTATATRAWDVVESGNATLVTDNELQFEADTDRLEQLLENLFRNAVDHNRPDVTVRIGALEDETGFYVEDNGTGIPENEREQVFELGHSTDSNGTGFGLAIVAEIAAAHDWSITATESGNGGARFEVTTGEIAPNLP